MTQTVHELERYADIRAALADPAMSKYGFQQGYLPYRRAASEYLRRRFGQSFDPVTEILRAARRLLGVAEGGS